MELTLVLETGYGSGMGGITIYQAKRPFMLTFSYPNLVLSGASDFGHIETGILFASVTDGGGAPRCTSGKFPMTPK